MREHRRTKQWIEVEKSAAATTTPRCARVLMGTRWGRAMPARSSSRAAHLLQRVRARLLAMGAQLRDRAISTTSMGDPSKRHPVCPLWVLPDLGAHDRDVRFTPMSRRRWLGRLRPKKVESRMGAVAGGQRPSPRFPSHRGTGAGSPPPVPTERGVRLYRTTLFGSWFTALQAPAASRKGGAV